MSYEIKCIWPIGICTSAKHRVTRYAHACDRLDGGDHFETTGQRRCLVCTCVIGWACRLDLHQNSPQILLDIFLAISLHGVHGSIFSNPVNPPRERKKSTQNRRFFFQKYVQRTRSF